ATFLKRCLSVPKTSKSRLAYVLCNTTFLIEDLRMQYHLEPTQAYSICLEKLLLKRSSIAAAFYQTQAMLNRVWQGPNNKRRHITTRFSVHGFHFKICEHQSFHEPDSTCKCTLCGEMGIDSYHFMLCVARTQPISFYAV